MKPPCRHLLLVLGDQLDIDSSLFDGLDTARDAVLIIEAFEESTHVWSHKARTALFLSAMRHFADDLRAAQAAGKVTSRGLVDAYLARIQAYDQAQWLDDLRTLAGLGDAAGALAAWTDAARLDHESSGSRCSGTQGATGKPRRAAALVTPLAVEMDVMIWVPI